MKETNVDRHKILTPQRNGEELEFSIIQRKGFTPRNFLMDITLPHPDKKYSKRSRKQESAGGRGNNYWSVVCLDMREKSMDEDTRLFHPLGPAILITSGGCGVQSELPTLYIHGHDEIAKRQWRCPMELLIQMPTCTQGKIKGYDRVILQCLTPPKSMTRKFSNRFSLWLRKEKEIHIYLSEWASVKEIECGICEWNVITDSDIYNLHSGWEGSTWGYESWPQSKSTDRRPSQDIETLSGFLKTKPYLPGPELDTPQGQRGTWFYLSQ